MAEEHTSGPRQRKRLGQVFLRSPRAIERIISSLALEPDDVVLEIGAGDGGLSARIAPLVGRLFLNELDERFVEVLRRRFESAPSVDIVPGDILSGETFDAVRAAAAGIKLVVYGSLPYYISTPILRWAVDRFEDVQRASFLVQREVAQRAAAAPGTRQYGFLSVLMQRRAEVDLGPVIKRSAFKPTPKVDSQLLHLRPRRSVDLGFEVRFERLVSALFQQRRKKIINSLRAYLGYGPPEEISLGAAREGFSLDQRPGDLSPGKLETLFRLVERYRVR